MEGHSSIPGIIKLCMFITAYLPVLRHTRTRPPVRWVSRGQLVNPNNLLPLIKIKWISASTPHTSLLRNE